MRLLVLEDDQSLGQWLVQGLRDAGHVVDWFADGKQALVAAMSEQYEVFIFDRMVPSLDGLSVLKALRQAKVTSPVIFLTALGEVEDRVEGLRAGGDDYLAKPFAFSELLARIEAVVRRSGEIVENSVQLASGDIVLDLQARSCIRQKQTVELNPKEFLLLEVFMRSKGRLQTRAMLLERVWGLSFDPTTSVVETHISRLRRKIEKPFGDTIIRTVRGAGYVFEQN